MATPGAVPIPASFRDPAGYVYFEDGLYKRAVLPAGQNDFRLFHDSGLYGRLAEDELILPHREEHPAPAEISHVVVPEQLEFVSYPYEWCFGQLKDAALLTLAVQEHALRHGMSLKDASAFNVQFRGCRPVFIDTLSFERDDGGAWVAYHQFCRHFLAPLLLMVHVAPSVNRLLAAQLDGFPLELTSRLLPLATRFRPGSLLHIHWHARALRSGHATPSAGAAPRGPDRKAAIVSSLRATIERLHLPSQITEWSEYYRSASHYGPQAEDFKKTWVSRWLGAVRPRLVFDLGANQGAYSRLAAADGALCVSFETDPICANDSYERARAAGDLAILPLLMDLREPSSSLGFDLSERLSLFERPKADVVLALALVHHLRITGQIPLSRIARFLARLGRDLMIEFVPKNDPMVCLMLRHRKDAFEDYSQATFLKSFERHFRLEDLQAVPGTTRTLCFFRSRHELHG